MLENLEELRKNYFKSILYITDEEDLLANLPDVNSKNFVELISGIIALLGEELVELNDVIKEDPTFIEERDLLEKKINICNKLLSERYNKEQKEEVFEEINLRKNIIFATRSNDQAFFYNDLKDIPTSLYGDLLDTIDLLSNGTNNDNPEKGRKLNSNNKKRLDFMKKKDGKLDYFIE